MTYREFCDKMAPMIAEMKELCRNMPLKEFEDYKNQIRQETCENKKVSQFTDKVFDIINPIKESVI